MCLKPRKGKQNTNNDTSATLYSPCKVGVVDGKLTVYLKTDTWISAILLFCLLCYPAFANFVIMKSDDCDCGAGEGRGEIRWKKKTLAFFERELTSFSTASFYRKYIFVILESVS